jgi:hypothetical protein
VKDVYFEHNLAKQGEKQEELSVLPKAQPSGSAVAS